MAALWIILCLLLLIFVLPYGIDAGYEGGEIRLGVKAGPFRLWLLPRQTAAQGGRSGRTGRKDRRRAKRRQEPAGEEEASAEKGAGKKKQPDPDFLLALAGMALRALKRVLRGISIDLLRFHCVVAAEDPCDTALLYGGICAGLSALPQLPARRRDVQIRADFEAERPSAEGRIVLSLQLYKLFFAAAVFGLEFLRWKHIHRQEEAGGSERTENNGRKQDQ